MEKFRRITFVTSLFFVSGLCNLYEREPPVLVVERHWTVLDTEPVGSFVAVARGSAGGRPSAHIVYALEQDSNYNIAFPTAKGRPLPFRIDNVTGIVYTNATLTDRGGEQIYLYVTAYDGNLTQKTGVLAAIVNSSAGVVPHVRPGRPPLQLPGLLRGGITPPPMLEHPRRPQQPTKLRPTNQGVGRLPPVQATPINTTPNPITVPTTSSTTDSGVPTSVVPTEPPPPITSPKMADIALTIVPIVVICLMFAVAGIGTFLCRKKICSNKKAANKEDLKKNSNGLREEPMVLQHWRGPRAFSNRYTAWDPDTLNVPTQEAPPLPEKSVDRWEFPRHRLKVFNILGEGCFGQVWKCEAQDIDGNEGPSIVAVKTLKENAGERERTDLLQELQLMKLLDPHPNVVRLIGCCTDKDPLFVIMEYVPNGKLQSFLRNSRAQRCYDNMHGKSNSLTSRQLTSFCYQVARGMQFLSKNGIIHRDLAARNVLVDENLICKVADFGFARDVMASHIYERKSEGRLPIRWMAPESLYDNVFSVKSDVWSFGVLIWEIVTLGSTPYPGLSAAEVMKRVKEGYRLDKPEHCKRELYNIMYYCWDQHAKERPDFGEVVDLLEQLLTTETDYIELQHFPDHCYYNIVSLSGEKL